MRDGRNPGRDVSPGIAASSPIPGAGRNDAGRASSRPGSAGRGRRRRTGQLALVAAVFALSVAPAAMTWLNAHPDLQTKLQQNLLATVPGYGHVAAAYDHANTPVEEMRKMAELPTAWQGDWHAIDKNYARFEHWFADNVGMRSLMIRTKNELDYQLFRSSSRVYFGKNGELYNRRQTDIELTATENVLATPEQRTEVLNNLTAYARQLKHQGVTMVLVPPVSKHYFTGANLPWFAPRLPQPSSFMQFYEGLLLAKDLNTIDVNAIQRAHENEFPIYFREDFHWTDVTAMTVAAAVTERIAQLEGSPLRWQHERKYEFRNFVGVEARFASRLQARDGTVEPQLVKTWQDRPRREHNAQQTGLEFDTAPAGYPASLADGTPLLPNTCLYGNSFSDGMLRAGLPEHFKQFTKISRHLSLPALPALAQSSQCKYLVVQLLDTQTGYWLLR